MLTVRRILETAAKKGSGTTLRTSTRVLSTVGARRYYGDDGDSGSSYDDSSSSSNDNDTSSWSSPTSSSDSWFSSSSRSDDSSSSLSSEPSTSTGSWFSSWFGGSKSESTPSSEILRTDEEKVVQLNKHADEAPVHLPNTAPHSTTDAISDTSYTHTTQTPSFFSNLFSFESMMQWQLYNLMFGNSNTSSSRPSHSVAASAQAPQLTPQTKLSQQSQPQSDIKSSSHKSTEANQQTHQKKAEQSSQRSILLRRSLFGLAGIGGVAAGVYAYNQHESKPKPKF